MHSWPQQPGGTLEQPPDQGPEAPEINAFCLKTKRPRLCGSDNIGTQMADCTMSH